MRYIDMIQELILLLFVSVVTGKGIPGLPLRRRDNDNSPQIFKDLNAIKGRLQTLIGELDAKRDVFAATNRNWHPSEVESDEVDKNKLKNVNDVAYLHMLTSTAKNVVGGIEADDESKRKAITKLESLAGKFLTTVQDMKAGKGGEKEMVKLEPLKDQLRSIARDMEAMLRPHLCVNLKTNEPC